MKYIYCLSFATLFIFSACNKKNINDQVIEECEMFNKYEAPKRLDQYTIIDSMSFNETEHTLIYYYTLEGEADNKGLISEEFIENLHQQLLNNVINSINLKNYKEAEMNFEYKYISKTRHKVFVDVLIKPEEYNK